MYSTLTGSIKTPLTSSLKSFSLTLNTKQLEETQELTGSALPFTNIEKTEVLLLLPRRAEDWVKDTSLTRQSVGLEEETGNVEILCH